MDNQKENKFEPSKNRKLFTRKKQDVELKQQLLLSPESFITERGSDEGLDKLSLKIKLLDGREFVLEDYILEQFDKYEPKFCKDWYYALADLYSVDRREMDVYVKPDFVRLFTIQFVYARFPYMILRTLRSRKRKNKVRGIKLFQYLKKDISGKLDTIIGEVYDMMIKYPQNIKGFQEVYCGIYKVHFQIEMSF